MNERFKFRVWDKYIQSYVKENLGEEYVWIEDDGQLGAGIDDSCILEQCTGLKDKNGNLIYEGDVIRDKYMTEFVIKWVDSGFIMSDIDETQPDDGLRQGWLNLCEFEIIGNIHEQAKQKD